MEFFYFPFDNVDLLSNNFYNVSDIYTLVFNEEIY
jgi:hypothetical protein